MKNDNPSVAAAPSMAALVAKVSLLAEKNRDAYRELRKVMWQFVVENSSRSDFPSEMS